MTDEFQQGHTPAVPGHWSSEFPYHWDADDLVSRRELLRFAVLTSGALFGGTTLLAVLRQISERRRGMPKPIVQARQVAEGDVFYFNYPDPDDQAMLLHLPGGQFVAYSQKCTHLSCSVYFQSDQKRLYCPCHHGVFEPQTGEPIAGPPQRRLPRINLRRDGDTIIALKTNIICTICAMYQFAARWRHYYCGGRGAVMRNGYQNGRKFEPYHNIGTEVSSSDSQVNVNTTPGQQAIVLAALFIGLLFLGVQLWLLTVALDLFLSNQSGPIWLLPIISGLIFVGGLVALRMLKRQRPPRT